MSGSLSACCLVDFIHRSHVEEKGLSLQQATFIKPINSLFPACCCPSLAAAPSCSHHFTSPSTSSLCSHLRLYPTLDTNTSICRTPHLNASILSTWQAQRGQSTGQYRRHHFLSSTSGSRSRRSCQFPPPQPTTADIFCLLCPAINNCQPHHQLATLMGPSTGPTRTRRQQRPIYHLRQSWIRSQRWQSTTSVASVCVHAARATTVITLSRSMECHHHLESAEDAASLL